MHEFADEALLLYSVYEVLANMFDSQVSGIRFGAAYANFVHVVRIT